jgi:hypothetical protein
MTRERSAIIFSLILVYLWSYVSLMSLITFLKNGLSYEKFVYDLKYSTKIILCGLPYHGWASFENGQSLWNIEF